MILDEIVSSKREELEGARSKLAEAELRAMAGDRPSTRGFEEALRADGVRVIAEVKKASPSKGVIRADFDPVRIAHAYEDGGGAAISVLTEERYFQGSLDYLRSIGEEVELPLLRKDFLFDPYQLFEARVAGADAVLLIAAILEASQMADLIGLSTDLELDVLVEVHTLDELQKSLSAGAVIIGVNNRDLKTFKTDIKTTFSLVEHIPETCLKVSESGINTVDDIERLSSVGVDAFLIGEALMREDDPGKKLKELIG